MGAQKDGTFKIEKKVSRVLNEKSKDSMNVYNYIEVMPEFPGGDPMLLKYIASNVNYPQSAKNKGLQGECIVQFVVDTNGRVTNVKALKNVPNCPQCDDEAIRAVSMLPNWKPGKTENGELVNVYYTVPIKYILRGGGCF
jgi:periplasmic protein TonB